MEVTPHNMNPPSETGKFGMDRRTFLGALGVAAASGLVLQKAGLANQAAQDYYYQDSFGNVGPAGSGAVDFGVLPPPVMDADPEVTGSAYSTGYPLHNILLVIVDQMRNPAFWVPAANAYGSGQQIVNSFIPNISQLASASFYFPHYFTAATVCGPARACLATGLYAQQHCLFQSSNPDSTESTPPLLPFNPNWAPGSMTQTPGFPTIGNVLSQPLSAPNSGPIHYDCTWIGKWHLSCVTGNSDGSIGQNGPRDYGFNATYSIPNIWPGVSPYVNNAYPSPNGLQNEGAGGDFLDSYAQLTPGRDVPLFTPVTFANNSAIPNFVQLNDAAIAWAFTNKWLPNANTNLNRNNGTQLLTPWFCAVSLINPHDITDFPFTYGLTITPNNNFTGGPSVRNGASYQPAPVLGTPAHFSGNDCYGGFCGAYGDNMNIPAFPAAYAGLPPGAGGYGNWNYESLSAPALQYANNGKPGMQYYVQQFHNSIAGSITAPGTYYPASNSWSNPTPWDTFLNYYLWMQSCVDYQVGQVLGTNPSSPTVNPGLQQYPKFWQNTVIVFTSDHGEYGGSHGIHTKGGAVYEESMNVPLYVSFPSMRNNSTITAPTTVTYTCSSVDILPFLYALALGNELWRANPNDMIAYLNGRESIFDGIYKYEHPGQFVQQRRLSNIPLHNASAGPYNETLQPFVLHTFDDIPVATVSPSLSPVPSHVIGFRTVDYTDVNSNSAPFYPANSYGGGKLGIYSYWNTCGQLSAPIFGINSGAAPNQYEFYNYSPHPPSGTLAPNPQEVGNQLFDGVGGNTAQGQSYFNDFYGIGAYSGNSIQQELYQLNAGTSPGANTQQVQAAIQVAYEQYRSYLFTHGTATGPTGNNSSC